MQALSQLSLRLSPTIRPVVSQTHRRGVVTFFDSYERADWEVAEFNAYSRWVGQDEYPFYRKSHRTPAQKQAMRQNRYEGRISNMKVYGLVRFIQLKQDMKYADS